MDVEYYRDPIFGFEVPTTCPGVPDEVLDPRATWADGTAYDEKAAAQCAADAFLTKPFDSESLVRLVEVLISAPPARIDGGPRPSSSTVDLASRRRTTA